MNRIGWIDTESKVSPQVITASDWGFKSGQKKMPDGLYSWRISFGGGCEQQHGEFKNREHVRVKINSYGMVVKVVGETTGTIWEIYNHSE